MQRSVGCRLVGSPKATTRPGIISRTLPGSTGSLQHQQPLCCLQDARVLHLEDQGSKTKQITAVYHAIIRRINRKLESFPSIFVYLFIFGEVQGSASAPYNAFPQCTFHGHFSCLSKLTGKRGQKGTPCFFIKPSASSCRLRMAIIFLIPAIIMLSHPTLESPNDHLTPAEPPPPSPRPSTSPIRVVASSPIPFHTADSFPGLNYPQTQSAISPSPDLLSICALCSSVLPAIFAGRSSFLPRCLQCCSACLIADF